MTTPLRIGGVPEHFNLPWHLVLESPLPADLGIDARWQDFPDGSGAMAAALLEGRIDAAMLLTEGAVAGVAAGGGFDVVSLYTESPLVWGIHVPAASRFAAVGDVRGARYAISRRGSGSHLMAFVHAREQGWPLDALQLVVVGNLQGAHVLGAAARLAASSDGAARIAARYALDRDDVVDWLRATRWAARPGIESRSIEPTIGALRDAGLVERGLDAARVIGSLPPARV